MNKYELRTRKLEKELNKLKEIIKPSKEKAKKVHHKISTKDLTYTSPSGKTRGFRNVKVLNKFISKKEKEIQARKLRSREKAIQKRQRELDKKQLSKIEKDIKKMYKKAKTLKGKKKENLEKKASELKRVVEGYKKIKKQKPKIAGLGRNKKTAEKVMRQTIFMESTRRLFNKVWGIWELNFSGDYEMNAKREILYKTLITDEELKNLEDLFDLLYELQHSDDIEGLQKVKEQIIAEVDNLIEKYHKEDKDDLSKPWE